MTIRFQGKHGTAAWVVGKIRPSPRANLEHITFHFFQMFFNRFKKLFFLRPQHSVVKFREEIHEEGKVRLDNCMHDWLGQFYCSEYNYDYHDWPKPGFAGPHTRHHRKCRFGDVSLLEKKKNC
jgi:hypothetical protein